MTTSEHTPQNPEIAKYPKSILVIDDDEAINYGMTRMLRKLGHEVQSARNLEFANVLLADNSFDFILCDCVFKGSFRDGIQFITEHAESNKYPNTRWILISAFINTETIADGIEYYEKPVSTDFLRELLDQP